MTTKTNLKEKTCARCDESWPADTEFFTTDRAQPDRLSERCRACIGDCYYNRRNFGQLTQSLCGVFTALVAKQEHPALTNK